MIALIILCLVVSSNALLPLYSDKLSRDVMLPLSAAAYSNNPDMCLKRLFRNSTLSRQTTVRCGVGKTTCSGYTAVLHAQRAIVLSFRGTTEFLQLLDEAAKSAFNAFVHWFFGGRVSSYFGNAFTKIWNEGMGEDFVNLRKKYPDYEIFVTGHSLGGSMASLATSYIIGEGLADATKTRLVTFGQPRTGDKVYSNIHQSQAQYAFRVVHWRDIVPHILSVGYNHHKQEAFYRSGMKPNGLVVCNADEAKQCSNGLFFTSSINDHTHYFGKQVSFYGMKGCA